MCRLFGTWEGMNRGAFVTELRFVTIICAPHRVLLLNLIGTGDIIRAASKSLPVTSLDGHIHALDEISNAPGFLFFYLSQCSCVYLSK